MAPNLPAAPCAVGTTTPNLEQQQQTHDDDPSRSTDTVSQSATRGSSTGVPSSHLRSIGRDMWALRGRDKLPVPVVVYECAGGRLLEARKGW
jgi:hypothetical protein